MRRVGNNYSGARFAFSQRRVRVRYDIDWSDLSFPEIVRTPGGSYTLTEAKREVVKYFAGQRDHARAQIARFRAMKAEDVLDA